MKKLSVFLFLFLMMCSVYAENLISFNNIPLGCDRNYVINKMDKIGFYVFNATEKSMSFISKEDSKESIYTLTPITFTFYFDGDSLNKLRLYGYTDMDSLIKCLKENYPDLHEEADRVIGINKNELVLIDSYSFYELRIDYYVSTPSFDPQNISISFAKSR